ALADTVGARWMRWHAAGRATAVPRVPPRARPEVISPSAPRACGPARARRPTTSAFTPDAAERRDAQQRRPVGVVGADPRDRPGAEQPLPHRAQPGLDQAGAGEQRRD